MANSAFNLSSGIGADGRSIRAQRVQDAHGFSVGDAIRFVPHANGLTGDFLLAQADSSTNAESVGIVETVSTNEFEVVYQGEINTSNFKSGVGITGSDVWFLDATVAGGITATAPISAGSVVKPIITLVSGSNDGIGLVTNYIGTIVGGDNTVSLDTVHPVGEIMPWGGETYNIPDGWQLCDGGTVDTGTYPEYYTRVGTKFGYWADCDISFTTGHDSALSAGATVYQNLPVADPATNVYSSIISYTALSSTTGRIVLDPDYLTGRFLPGGETSEEITPHGLVFEIGPMTGETNTRSIPSSAVTIIAAKTPDLRARHIITANENVDGTFNGYTAGQIGGMEDATDTVEMNDAGGGNWAYVASGDGKGTLRSPYMALHHIIRIDSMSKSALVGDISVNDDGIIDHLTTGAEEGDILLYGNVSGTDAWRNIKIFNNWPSDTDTLENNFRIDTSNGNVAIGHTDPTMDIDIKRAGNVDLRLERTNANACELVLQAADSGGYVRTFDASPLMLGTDSLIAIKINNAAVLSGRVEFSKDVHINTGLNFTAPGLTTTGNIVVGGQAYSPSWNQTGNSLTFDVNAGNVMKWSRNGAFTLTAISNHKSGGAYSIIIDNTGTSYQAITLPAECKFANNIEPQGVIGGGTVVISMLSDGTDLYCTYADFA